MPRLPWVSSADAALCDSSKTTTPSKLSRGVPSPTGEPGHDLLQPVDACGRAVFLSRLALERVVARKADAVRALNLSFAVA